MVHAQSWMHGACSELHAWYMLGLYHIYAFIHVYMVYAWAIPQVPALRFGSKVMYVVKLMLGLGDLGTRGLGATVRVMAMARVGAPAPPS